MTKENHRSIYSVHTIIVAVIAILFGLYISSSKTSLSMMINIKQKPLEYYYEEFLRWIPNSGAPSPQSSSGIVAAYYNIIINDGGKSNSNNKGKGVKSCSDYAKSSLVWLDEMTVEEASSVFSLSPEIIVSDEALVQQKVDNFMVLRGGCVFVDSDLGFELIRRPIQKESFNDFVREKGRNVGNSKVDLNAGNSKVEKAVWMVESKSQSSDWKDTIFLNRHKPWRAYRSNFCIPLTNNYGGDRTRQGTHTIYECKSSYVKMIVFKDESFCHSYLKQHESQDEGVEDEVEDFDEDSIVLEHDYSFQNYRRFCI